MKIELVPGLGDPDIKLRFEARLVNCLNVKGCVAFWTIDVKAFNFEALKQAIKRQNSFYCVDIQQPTNIDSLTEYVKLGATEIYLHKYRLDPTQYNLNTNLLHSKVVLFELSNNEIEIWIGSHNLTHFALSGFNLEASTVINCSKSDKIYDETLSYLNQVKNTYCDKFDLTKVDIYKKLQTRDARRNIIISGGATKVEAVVTLVGMEMENLKDERVIFLLSLNKREFSKFKKIGTTIFLHTFDIKTKKENLYVCKISQSGEIDFKSPKLDIDFTEPRRFAYIGTGKLSYLKASMKVDKKILKVSRYFVNLTIHYEVKNFQIFENPALEEISLWQDDKKSPYKQRINNREKHPIQVATYEASYKPVPVKIGYDWNELGEKYKGFYEKIDDLIRKEYELSKSINSDEINKKFDDFLKDCDNHLNLPKYSKSQVERIILEREK